MRRIYIVGIVLEGKLLYYSRSQDRVRYMGTFLKGNTGLLYSPKLKYHLDVADITYRLVNIRPRDCDV